MQNSFYLILFILGNIFGSFASVLIFRIHEKKPGIINGRSCCPNCNNQLGFLELVPIFSWIFLGGKCKNCKNKIGVIYPILEICTGIMFSAIGMFLLDFQVLVDGNGLEILKLIVLLILGFVTIIFIFYDILYTEIPDEIMIPGIFIAFIILLSDTFLSSNFFIGIKGFNGYLSIPIINGIVCSLIIYTFFYLQIIIPGGIFAIQTKKEGLLKWLIVLYFTFFYEVIRDFFVKNKTTEEYDNEEDGPQYWIGFGDLMIAIFMGLVGGIKLGLIGLFLGYIIGSIVGIMTLILRKINNKNDSQIPFGPYLGIGLWLSLFFGDKLMACYMNLIFSF
ncbi:MAG: prepilin peptidase [Candidatus Gracilibacteria bacterium]|nr:prepilin peptidase [Candidatus Gracilibacteria bacterium]MDD3120319.1 prepilin peptidase [Candidatus Gracilibacteria bacterium]MDD4530844.1 prepilin peptidase [Candidatus Gracilibacteria bacterium]